MNLTCLMTDQLRRIHTWQIRREDVPTTCSRHTRDYESLLGRISEKADKNPVLRRKNWVEFSKQLLDDGASFANTNFRHCDLVLPWGRVDPVLSTAVKQAMSHLNETGFYILKKKTQTKKDELHHRLTINKYWLVVSLY